MTTVLLPESPVAKNSAKSGAAKPNQPFERIEFQAPPGFTKRLNAARKRRGLSKSAYCRQAVLLLIEEDEK